ncbi:transport and Golgi organization protein 6 homolog [Saccoglossus kowalevskii]|uniref:Transport and Golgi organization protein 6 homolog n=1 Tax=Saccoglossus kowalevskii TaxID=10224 RepID=A0ABM0MK63_SACKO|nr:PREDICTED: transport and Golgi organization protein 6 homolog [Saccoglossus kowalevskii]
MANSEINVLSTIKILTTCATSTERTDMQAEDSLLKTLDVIMMEVDTRLQEDHQDLLEELITEHKWNDLHNTTHTQWKYVQYCVKLLEFYILKTSNQSQLRIDEQHTLQTVLQLIVCFGIAPNLIPGVGIPLQKRTHFASCIPCRSTSAFDCDYQLLFCVKSLMSFCRHASLASVILTKHLTDILACFLQLCHAPRKKDLSGLSEQQRKEAIFLKPDEKDWCNLEFEKLLDRVYQPLLIQELIVLQGGVSHRAPKWLKLMCGEVLSDRLLKHNGVMAAVKGVLLTTACNPGTADWQKCEGLGRLIASCPKKIQSVEEYYRLIAPQVLGLLRHHDDLQSPLIYRVASHCITNMFLTNRELTQKYIIQELYHPFQICIGDITGDSDTILSHETQVTQSIHDIYHVCCCNTDHTMVSSLKPILQPLFQMYCYSLNGVSHLRIQLEEILKTFFNQSDRELSLEYLSSLVFAFKKSPLLTTMNERVCFTPGSEGGIVIEISSSDCDRDFECTMTSLIELLESLKNKSLTADFFMQVLKEFTSILGCCARRSDTNTHTGVSDSQTLLELENQLSMESLNYMHTINVMSLISLMCERLGESIFQRTSQILEFIATTLERMCEVRATGDNVDDAIVNDTVTMILGILLLVYQLNPQMNSDESVQLKKLIPILGKLAATFDEPLIKEMTTDLQIAIATHGVMKLNTSCDTVKGAKPERNGQQKVLRKKDNLSDEASQEDESSPPSVKKSDVKSACQETRHDEYVNFDTVFTELKDPLLPVRAHAIRKITKLLDRKDEQALKMKESLLDVFQENLHSDDSYMYLSVIQGLVALVDVNTQPVMALLCQEYRSDKNSVEMRLKIGEALMRASQRIGAMLPVYTKQLIGVLLSGAKEDCSDIRSSSLSNLAELCYVLKAAISSVIHEILNCISHVIKTDDVNEVRRAAVHVIRQLLCGLQQESIEILEHVLKDMYGMLKYVVQHDKDDVTKLHAQLALEDLQGIMTAYIFPKQSLTKKITVLP